MAKTAFVASWTNAANGQTLTATRTSDRAYTHAAVYANTNQPLTEAYIGSFHGSKEAASKGTLTGAQRRYGLTVIAVVELTVQEKPKREKKPKAPKALRFEATCGECRGRITGDSTTWRHAKAPEKKHKAYAVGTLRQI